MSSAIFMALIGAAVLFSVAFATAAVLPPIPDFDPNQVIEVDPGRCSPAPGNRHVLLELLDDLLESIKTHGQLVPGLIYPDPERPGHWYVLEGNRRCCVRRALGLPFLAVALPCCPPEPERILIRDAIARTFKATSMFDRAMDALRFIQITGCTDKAAAAAFGVATATMCVMLGPLRRCPSHVQEKMAAGGEVNRGIAYHVSRAPTVEQMEFLIAKAERGLMTKERAGELVSKWIREAGGSAPKTRSKKFKIDLGVLVTRPAGLGNAELIQALRKFIAGLKGDDDKSRPAA